MKPVFKYALAGLALAAASSGAYASVAAPSSGNGDLVLFVRDLSNPNRVFATGLGVSLDSLLNQQSITNTPSPSSDPAFTDLRDGAPITVNAVLPTFHSDALQSFLQTASNYDYAIMGGDSVGANSFSNAWRYAGTNSVQFDSNNPSTTSNNNINNASGIGGAINAFFGDLNAALGASSFLTDFSEYGKAGTNGATAPGLFDAPFGTNGLGAALGTATNLYMLTSSSATTSGSSFLARLYQFADVTLDSTGTLSSASVVVPQVPLPAAVWLLGSALVGLGTVRRRRQTEAVAA